MNDEEREEYYVPTNYNNSGRYLWGLTSGRNLLEMVIVLVPVVLIAHPLLLGLPMTKRIVILLFIIFGLGAPLAIGIDGGSFGQYIYRIIVFMFTNKKYSLERINEPEHKEPEVAEGSTDAEKAPEKAKKMPLKERLIEKSITKLEALRSKKNAEKEESK